MSEICKCDWDWCEHVEADIIDGALGAGFWNGAKINQDFDEMFEYPLWDRIPNLPK